MGERANGLRDVSRQNASGLPMLVGTDPAASASRVRYTSRRASLYRRNGDVFARLDKIATPSKVLSQLAWRAASPPVGVCPQRLAGPVPVGSHRFFHTEPRSLGGLRRGLSPSRRASPRRERGQFPLVSGSIKFSHRLHLHFGIKANNVRSWSGK